MTTLCKVIDDGTTSLWEIHYSDGGGYVCALESESMAYTFAASHDMLFALDVALNALTVLCNHPAFAGDAHEFNEGGVGYEAGQVIREAIDAARADSTDEHAANRERHARRSG